MVHSSLRSIGYVLGGAQTVVGSLLKVLGPDGTLVMPAFSPEVSDPAGWSSYFPRIGDEFVNAGHASVGFVGQARSILASSHSVVDFATEFLSNALRK